MILQEPPVAYTQFTNY